MYFRYKKHLWFIFAAFFLALSPFLAVYSLGYSLDIDEGKLGNTIDISVNTVPRGAKVWNQNFEVLTTPGSLKAKDGQLISLEITRDGFFSEKFDIWSQPKENTTARLEDIYLLPLAGQIKSEGRARQFLSILSKDLVLYKQDKSLFVQLYGFNGLSGSPEEVKIPEEYDLDLGITQWEDLLEDVYWQPSEKLILYRSGSEWKILDLRADNLDIVSVARVNNTSVLILDTEKKLWLQNLPVDTTPSRLQFISNEIDGLGFTKSPDSIWLWRKNELFSIPKGNITLVSFNLEAYRYVSSNDFEELVPLAEDNKVGQDVKFAVKNVHQGLVFKINRSLYYIADYAKDSPLLISTNSTSFASASNTVFWLDNEFGLYSLNLGIDRQQYFGILDVDITDLRNLRLFYYNKWERIVVYSENKVSSVWFDKNILNKSVAVYYPNTWIQGSECKDGIYEDFQFCLKDNNLVSYQNTEIW